MKNISLFHQLAGWAAVRAGVQRCAVWLLLALFGALAAQAQPAAVQQNNYPAAGRIGWVNVKSYGAKGDGVTDDTKAIRKAITTYPREFQTVIVVYFPDGNYLVSDSLRERDGYYDGYVTFQGQSTAGTVIKLKDNAPGFQDVANPRPVVYVSRGGNQSFNQYFFNLTINTGRGNPGAVALDYITSNLGAVKNVVLTSDDGQGYCGLRMDRQWPGPGLIKNLTISGFQYGVRMSNSEYSMTFEHLVLRNQSVLGIRNAGNEAIIRGLTSDNAVPVIETANQLVLLDGTFRGGSTSTPAIVNKGFAYVRNTTAGGYANVVSTNGTAVPGTTVQEYSSQVPTSVFPHSGGLMLNLPVKETPEYVNNDTTQWANVRDYGARDADRFYDNPANPNDATAGIQAAFNSGKPVVYFPAVGSNGSAYQIYRDITIPASVKLIIGFAAAAIAQNNGARLLVQEASSGALIFERIGVGKVVNNSTRTVAFKHMSGDYDNGPNSGDLFIEDFVGRVVPTHAMNMWARQLNTEIQAEGDLNVLNPGGNYWILGQKTEGRAIVNKTTNGGSSEILGGLLYPASSFTTGGPEAVALVSENGCIAAIFSATSYVNNGFYPVYASETRNGETKQVRGFTQFYRAGCAAATPIPDSVAALSGTYRLLARHSGKALDIAGASTADGARALQWPVNGGANQLWKIEATDGGYYKLTAQHSGKVLDVSGASVDDGGPVHQWAYVGAANQQWKIEPTTDGYYKLTARHSGKALDVEGGVGATADGVPVQQWTYGNQANQQWRLEAVTPAGAQTLATSTAQSAAAAAAALAVYPNPATDQLTVQLTVRLGVAQPGEGQLVLTDPLGRVVRRQGLPAGSPQATLDVRGLPQGLYLLRVQQAGQTYSRKVVIQP